MHYWRHPYFCRNLDRCKFDEVKRKPPNHKRKTRCRKQQHAGESCASRSSFSDKGSPPALPNLPVKVQTSMEEDSLGMPFIPMNYTMSQRSFESLHSDEEGDVFGELSDSIFSFSLESLSNDTTIHAPVDSTLDEIIDKNDGGEGESLKSSLNDGIVVLPKQLSSPTSACVPTPVKPDTASVAFAAGKTPPMFGSKSVNKLMPSAKTAFSAITPQQRHNAQQMVDELAAGRISPAKTSGFKDTDMLVYKDKHAEEKKKVALVPSEDAMCNRSKTPLALPRSPSIMCWNPMLVTPAPYSPQIPTTDYFSSLMMGFYSAQMIQQQLHPHMFSPPVETKHGKVSVPLFSPIFPAEEKSPPETADV